MTDIVQNKRNSNANTTRLHPCTRKRVLPLLTIGDQFNVVDKFETGVRIFMRDYQEHLKATFD